MIKLRTAIIGFGAISQVHIAAIRDASVSEITGVCDIREDRLRAATEELPGIKLYSDYNEMLEEKIADVVHICTPHYLHKEMTIKALSTGHDVYLEKPAAMNCDEINEIIAASEKYGRKVCVSFQNRVTPCNRTAKEIIESGELGRVLGTKGIVTWHREGDYYTKSGWRGTWEHEGGGTLMNQSIHTLDLLCYFGGAIKKAEGTASLRTNRGTIEVEDTAEATLYYENGTVGVFYATNCHATDSPVEVEVVCEKGSLLLRDDMLYKRENKEVTAIAKSEAPIVGKFYWGAGHATMICNFYDVLKGEDKYYCDIREALPSMLVIESIYKKANETIVNKP